MEAVPVPYPSSAAVPEKSKSASRIVGLDIARGLAVLGMFGAHLLRNTGFLDWEPSSWIAIINGRSSILFAVLAGVSMAIMSGRTNPVTGIAAVQVRTRILTRSAILLIIAAILNSFSHGLALILDYYAFFFLLALPFLFWSPKRLFVTAGGVMVIMPVVMNLLITLSMRSEKFELSFESLSQYLISGVYPALLWFGFLLIGIAVGRFDLTNMRVLQRVLVVGLAMTLLGYGTGEIAEGYSGNDELQSQMEAALVVQNPNSSVPGEEAEAGTDVSDLQTGQEIDPSTLTEEKIEALKASKKAGESGNEQPALIPGEDVDLSGLKCQSFGGEYYCSENPMPIPTGDGKVSSIGYRDNLKMLGSWMPHSNTPFEAIGSSGFALMVISLMCMLPSLITRILTPLAAVGSMALTCYVAHAFAFVWFTPQGNDYRAYAIFVIIALLGAWLWKTVLGRGPLERLLSWVSKQAAQITGRVATSQATQSVPAAGVQTQ